MDDATRSKRIFAFTKLFVLLLIIIGIPVFLYVFCGDTVLNREWLSNLPELLDRHRNTAFLIIIAAQILQVIICVIPGQPIQYVSSYYFGMAWGYLLSITGAVIGATIAFYLARILGQDALHIIFGKEKVEEYRRKLNSGKGMLAVLIIYLIPGLPKDLVGYVAGISEMDFKPFIILSTIGRSPGMLGSLLIGHFIGTGNYVASAITAVVIVLILIACLVNRNRLAALLDSMEDREEQQEAFNG